MQLLICYSRLSLNNATTLFSGYFPYVITVTVSRLIQLLLNIIMQLTGIRWCGKNDGIHYPTMFFNKTILQDIIRALTLSLFNI